MDRDPAVRRYAFYVGGTDVKRFSIVVMIVLLSILLVDSAFAATSEAELVGVDQLEIAQPKEAVDVYGSLRADEIMNVNALLGKLWSFLTERKSDFISSALRNGAEILFVSFLSVLCCALSDSKTLPLVCACAVALVCVKNIFSCVTVGRQAMQTLTDYSHVLLPCLCTAAAAGGAWTSAGAKYAASAMVMDMMITAEQNVISPFLYTYASVAISAQLTGQPLLKSISGIMKLAVKWSMVLLTTGFTIYLSVTGILSGTVDAAASKAAKTVISGAIPVVGGILSDASGAILSGVQMLRNGVGVIGMLVILAVCAAPFLTLASHYLVYQITAGISASFGDKRVGNTIHAIGDVYGFLIGIVGSVSIMLLVSVISFMKTVSSG